MHVLMPTYIELMTSITLNFELAISYFVYTFFSYGPDLSVGWYISRALRIIKSDD